MMFETNRHFFYKKLAFSVLSVQDTKQIFEFPFSHFHIVACKAEYLKIYSVAGAMHTSSALDGLLLLASAATTVTEKKKRCRDPLAPTTHELRNSSVSQLEEHYAKSQRTPKTPNFMSNLSRRNTTNAMASVKARQPIEQPIQNLSFSSPEVAERISHEQRRLAIYSIFYSCYGGVDKDFWAENGVMNRLNILRGSRQSVEIVLDDILLARYV
jgi:hypothetical protein